MIVGKKSQIVEFFETFDKTIKYLLQCYCDGTTICSWGGSVCENEITWIPYVTFIQ